MKNAGVRSKHVVIFGAGITGLTVAHECSEAGLSVTLYEKAERVGGKAVSFRLPPDHPFAGAPVEHSIRALQSSYFSFFETLKRIPHSDGGNVFGRIKPLEGLFLTPGGTTKSGVVRDRLLDTSTSLSSMAKLFNMYRSMRDWGVSTGEFFSFLWMILDYLTSSDHRRRKTIGSQTFSEYARLSSRSAAYRQYVTCLAEISVAAKPNASAEVVLDLFSRFLTGAWLNIHGVQSLVNITDGPTFETLIDPWVQHLESLGVQLRTSISVEKLEVNSHNAATAAILSDGARIEADAYVMAIPHRTLRRVAPGLDAISGLALLQDECSSGFQFFLSDLPEGLRTRRSLNLVFGSPWNLVYMIEGPPVWSESVKLSPGVRAVLSVSISGQTAPGLVYEKSFFESTWEEVQEELLTQLGFRQRELILGASPDPLLQYVSGRWTGSTTLCIATPESQSKQFPVKTDIDGLFMAGEFTDSVNKTPNMEKANQAGKLCASAIFHRFGLRYPEERLRAPKIPFEFLKKLRG